MFEKSQKEKKCNNIAKPTIPNWNIPITSPFCACDVRTQIGIQEDTCFMGSRFFCCASSIHSTSAPKRNYN
jgi:hypothetical protein